MFATMAKWAMGWVGLAIDSFLFVDKEEIYGSLKYKEYEEVIWE